ncbi:MAG TPA: hypothetical protein VFH17_04695 [Coriobacteriia bacterium]|nr:hypothetical protein [Coriobacteriia bacterium]
MVWVRKSAIAMLAVALAAAAGTGAGCGRAGITFVSENAEYTLAQVEEVHATVAPPPSIAGRSTSDAPELRRDALAVLRGRGGESAELADVLTEILAGADRSVPYYGEAATVEGKASWVVLEVWGSEGGTLDNTRLWVFERDGGSVVYSSTRR